MTVSASGGEDGGVVWSRRMIAKSRPSLPERGRGVHGRPWVVFSAAADVAGQGDLVRVAGYVVAVGLNNVAFARQFLAGAVDEVPALAIRVAVGSVRRPPLPPMTIGGCGCCACLGSRRALVSW